MSIERRRTPRVRVSTEEVVHIELRRRVRLLDISLTGALIACDTPFPLGARGHLRAGLASMPFTADLRVSREHSVLRRTAETGLGAMFASMDDTSRRSLEQFLRRASE
jgi:c-di-GMP-binding flagellar brake protein YcgR